MCQERLVKRSAAGRGEPGMQGLPPIQDERGALAVGEVAASLLQQELRCGHIPVVTVPKRHKTVEAAGGNQGEFVGQGADPGEARPSHHLMPGAAMPLGAACQQLGGLDLGMGAGAEPGVAEPGALGMAGGKAFIGRWIEDSADHGSSIDQQGRADGEFGRPLGKGARAIDRIDHPDPRPVQAYLVIDALFRQPAIIRAAIGDHPMEQAIDRKIGFGDQLARPFVPLPGSGAKVVQRQGTSRAYSLLKQTLVVIEVGR